MNTIVKTIGQAALLSCLLFSVLKAHAAVDMFLQIEGIDGESTDSDYRDSMDILAWSEGLSIPVTYDTGGGGSVGKANAAPVPNAAAAVIALAVLGHLVSRAIPRAPAGAPDLKVSWIPVKETLGVMRLMRKQKAVSHSVLGISWFWFVGTALSAQLPNYAELHLGAADGNLTVYLLCLALFSVGTGAGSLMCEKLSGRTVEIGLVPMGALLALPPSVNVEALPLTREGRILARAYQRFGGYVVDATDKTMTLAVLPQGCDKQMISNLFADRRTIRDHLVRVLNNSPEHPGGPGERIAAAPATLKPVN